MIHTGGSPRAGMRNPLFADVCGAGAGSVPGPAGTPNEKANHRQGIGFVHFDGCGGSLRPLFDTGNSSLGAAIVRYLLLPAIRPRRLIVRIGRLPRETKGCLDLQYLLNMPRIALQYKFTHLFINEFTTCLRTLTLSAGDFQVGRYLRANLLKAWALVSRRSRAH